MKVDNRVKWCDADKHVGAKCKIRITQELMGVFPQYSPKVGQIYDAEYVDTSREYKKYPPVCIVEIAGKRIIVRASEFEVVRWEDGSD